jgi:hypothetical protein
MKVGNWTLVDEAGEPAVLYSVVRTHKGKWITLRGGKPPHKPSSTGRIYATKAGKSYTLELFPTVIGYEWVKS